MMTAPLLPLHWPAVRRIYEAGLATGNASFQTSAPSWEEWDRAHLAHSRLVALSSAGLPGAIASSGEGSPVGDIPPVVLGWVALSPVSSRPVYAGVAEVSIYIDVAHRGTGVGRLLMQALIAESEAQGIWTLQAGIFPENIPSIELHLRSGFRQIGIREKIGRMGDRWRDTVLLERRSKIY
jgi:L-amino acid N-acyltransferase YncA